MRVDPRTLLLSGIETTGTDSIEVGYHLRWFTGPALSFPAAAFPDRDTLTAILKGAKTGPLIWPGAMVKKGLLNDAIPPAYFIYRRPHAPRFEQRFRVEPVHLESLARTGRCDTGIPSLSVTAAA